jgi:hypothetical protein
MSKRQPLNIAALRSAAGPRTNPVEQLVQQGAVAEPVRRPEPVEQSKQEPAQQPPAPAGEAASAGPSPAGQRSRIGKVQIQGYFPEATRRRLKMLSVTSGKTMEDLLAEALEDLFRKHGA